MSLPRSVQLPSPGASAAGLLQQALPLPSGWERGISFAQTGCLAPFVVGECPSADDLKAAQRPGAAVTFRPVQVGQAVECSTLSGADPVDAGALLDVTASDALEAELYAATASTRDKPPDPALGNPSLSTSITSDLGDLDDVVQAVGCAEQTAAGLVHGRRLWVHLSVAAAAAAAAAQVIWRDGTRWRTTYGSTVLISPNLVAPAGTVTSLPVFVTLPVYAGLGQRQVLQDVDRTVNTATWRVEDIGLVAFDPCVVVIAGTGVTCSAAAGGG